MITFILIFIFIVLGIGLGLVAYSANNRKRANREELAHQLTSNHKEQPRGPGLD